MRTFNFLATLTAFFRLTLAVVYNDLRPPPQINDTDRFIDQRIKDPFYDPWFGCFSLGLMSATSRHIVPDVRYCDRYLYCESAKGIGVAVYCPENFVFSEARQKCVPYRGMAAERCFKRGADNLIPYLPRARCYADPVDDPAEELFTFLDRYYKRGPTKRSFYMCVKGYQRFNATAFTVECIDPDRPEYDVEEQVRFDKCFPKDHARQKQLDQLIAWRAHGGGSNCGGHYPRLAQITLLSGIIIKFDIDDRPMCPDQEHVLKKYGFGPHVRIRHNNDCTKFWTCGVNHWPVQYACPQMDVFDVRTDKCVFFEDAKAPCDRLYEDEPEELKALARLRHETEKIVQELKDFTAVNDFFAPKFEMYRQRIAKMKADNDGKDTPDSRRLADQLDLLQANLVHMKFNFVGSVSLTKPRHARAPKYTDPNAPAIPNFVEVSEEGEFICPALPLRNDVKPEDVDIRFNLVSYYNTSDLAFGTYNNLAVRGECGIFVECGVNEQVTAKRIGVTRGCHNNKVFNPPIFYRDWHKMNVRRGTGVCVNPELVKVPGCEDYVSNNPITTDEEDYSRIYPGEERAEFYEDADMGYEATQRQSLFFGEPDSLQCILKRECRHHFVDTVVSQYKFLYQSSSCGSCGNYRSGEDALLDESDHVDVDPTPSNETAQPEQPLEGSEDDPYDRPFEQLPETEAFDVVEENYKIDGEIAKDLEEAREELGDAYDSAVVALVEVRNGAVGYSPEEVYDSEKRFLQDFVVALKQIRKTDELT